jgi:hypothetical protein
MKTRRRKLRKGGKSIQGAQGCVVIPSLILSPDGKRDTTKVTKIFFLDSDFKEEKTQNDIILTTIDPRGSFTSASYTEDPIDLTNMTKEETAACYGLKGKDVTKLKFLNYKHLGISINELIQRPISVADSKKILIALSGLLPKIIEMNKSGVYHNDIHIGNILYNARDEHAYLIDFGLMSSSPGTPSKVKTPVADGTPDLSKELTDIIGFLYVVRQLLKYMSDQKSPIFSAIHSDFLSRNIRFISPLIASMLSGEQDINASRISALQFVIRIANTYEAIKGGNRKTLRRTR